VETEAVPNTSNGLPYPLSSEFFKDGAKAIQALAEALNLRVPFPKIVYIDGGYTTNQFGGIVVPAANFQARGGVGMTQQAGYSMVYSPAVVPANVIWLDVFTTVNGQPAPNSFIIVHAMVWGT
jgi:hypothetical protein